VMPAVAAVTADGINVGGRDLTLCRRFYPHKAPGEGQFLALMTRSAEGATSKPKKSHALPLSRAEEAVLSAFLADTLEAAPKGTPCRLRDSIFLAPDIPLPGAGVFAAGVCVGTTAKNRIEPHHQFFSAYGKLFCRQLSLTADDARVAQYLRGEEIACDELKNEKNGYTAVLFEGAPLGGGKHVNGKLKNHYPKGLRNKN